MPFIKKMVMQGFKSFPKKTEIPFMSEINVILGPNGSGKSNISDALCFVLGRTSIKSMRAAKAGNLIFLGSKSASPSKEASVELVFDNKDRIFSIEKDEVSIKRIVRRNGQSIYKINDATKTRGEVLFLLAQAGLDPNGFNIILQWEIQNFVRMPPIERRRIIEDVSGISVYEIRKEKSLKELEKTDKKLQEINTVLRERTSYLKNLERERQEALRYNKLKENVEKYKASIISINLKAKKKELDGIEVENSKRLKETDKIKKIIEKSKEGITDFNSKINSINLTIQKSTGIEQERINQEIANLRAEIAGLNVRIENYEEKISEISRQKKEFNDKIGENESSIKELQKEPVSSSKKEKEVDIKKKELEKLQEKIKNFYMLKSEVKSIKEKIIDKEKLLKNYSKESEVLLKQLDEISDELFDKNTDEDKLNSLKELFKEKTEDIKKLEKRRKELEIILHTNEKDISRHRKMLDKISKIDICPVCKSKITKDHIHSINSDSIIEIESLNEETDNSNKEILEIDKKEDALEKEIFELNSEILNRDSDMIKISNINDKREQIKIIHQKMNDIQKEIDESENKRKNLEKNLTENSRIEERYENLRIEIEEISLRSKENVDSEISFKQNELERMKISLKQISREENDLNEDLLNNKGDLEEKEKIINDKRKQDEELTKKFKKLISERESLQKDIYAEESKILESQNSLRNVENEINNFSIEKARINAGVENLENDLKEFPGVDIIKANKEELSERLRKTEETLDRIGSVNLLSLNVYDSVKKQYDEIKEKSEIIDREKEDILKIVYEIDMKKRKTFLKTLDALNELFTRNFATLNTKGRAYLELENRKEPFEGGLNILIKAGHGKYLDVNSLSGGERVLVALSLLFAIQEFKPYHFYVLDEIDASLDKRNSEKLAILFRKHMQKGQYIIVTHNDEIISHAKNLYGVSMHEGVSKIVSMRV